LVTPITNKAGEVMQWFALQHTPCGDEKVQAYISGRWINLMPEIRVAIFVRFKELLKMADNK
jgi:hypothetical protein